MENGAGFANSAPLNAKRKAPRILMKLKTTALKPSFQTISWFGDDVVDWSKAGMLCSLSGETRQLQKYHFGFRFDRAISSQDGVYAFIYEGLGTKGLLLKNGELLREINRSYY